MTLRLIIIGILLVWIESFLPGGAGPCDYTCYSPGHCHGIDMYQDMLPQWIVRPGMAVYQGVVEGLKTPLIGNYQLANFYLYGVGIPLLALLLSYGFRPRWYVVLLAAGLALHFALQEDWYQMCIEFCYRMGNRTGLAYVGVCAFVCILIPAFGLLVDLLATGIKLGCRVAGKVSPAMLD